ncbi:MAG TPA: hypothetical protein VJV78_42470 [Polyangiales bacterium]|nr:hypothetical protein [Polyangiales bacterium]
MLQAVWNPAGGLRYHLRARRHRSQLWAAFRSDLESWFADWRPPARRLAVVGPSGGYCLPLGLLARFERLVFFEPDPIARMVLSRRLRGLPGSPSLTWVTDDVWIQPLLRGGAPPVVSLARDTAILFSNFMGQLMFLVPDARWGEFCAAFKERVWPSLERVPWASFHDRLSGPLAPNIVSADCQGARLDDSKVLHWYGAHGVGELLDHGTAELVPPGRSYAYFHWPLIPDQHHLIEAVVGGVTS